MNLSLRLLTIALLTLGGTACQGPLEHTADYDYRQKHPLVVEPRIAALELASADGTLAAPDAARLQSFAGEYLRRGRGGIEITVGAGFPEDPTARAFAQSVAGALLNEGLHVSELRLQLVIDEPGIAPGTAALRFNSSVMRLPDCYDWSQGPANGPSPNFGCSLQRNLGAMVVDPQDMLESRELRGMAGDRAADVVDKYGQAKETWSVPLPLKADTKSQGGQ